MVSANPETASFTQIPRSPQVSILNVALLRLRRNLCAALSLDRIYHFWTDTSYQKPNQMKTGILTAKLIPE
jgi:hypothetical protein